MQFIGMQHDSWLEVQACIDTAAAVADATTRQHATGCF